MSAEEHAQQAEVILERAQVLINKTHLEPGEIKMIERANESATAHALTSIAISLAGAKGRGGILDGIDWLASAVRDR